MENLPLIPIEDSVVFPGMTVTLALEVGDAERVFLVPRHGEEFGSVGTVAQVADRMKLPGKQSRLPSPVSRLTTPVPSQTSRSALLDRSAPLRTPSSPDLASLVRPRARTPVRHERDCHPR